MSFGETPLYIFKRRHLQTHCRRRSDGGLTVSTVTLEWIEHGKFQENSALIWEVVFLMFISICFRMISYMNGCCTFRDCGIRGSRCRRKDTDRNNDLVRYCEWFFVSSNASSKHCVPEWFWGEIEDSGPKISTTRIPETHHCGGARPDPEISLQAANVKEEEPLTVVAQQTKVTHTGQTDESVISWGNPDDGGDCSVVQDQLKNVRQIQATECAFAAILADGSVVAWGNPDHGGDCSAVQDQLRNVRQIQATYTAFAVILADGSVIAWGNEVSGGDCSEVQDQLSNVQQNSGKRLRICGNLSRWISGCLGQSWQWWWLLRSSGSAPECVADSGDGLRICCDLSWWVSGCLGQSRPWWWLLPGSRSAQKRAANSGHRRCICSDLAWWVTGCLWSVRERQ